MTFRRHHHHQEEQKETVDPIIDSVKEILPEAKIVVIEPEVKKQDLSDPTEVSKLADMDTSVGSTRSHTKKPKKEIKKRKSNKPTVSAGLAGDTVEIRDFKAIVKRKGLQINVVLTDILKQ